VVRAITLLAAFVLSVVLLPGSPIGERSSSGGARAGWTRLAAPPRTFSAVAWTGRYLVAWGGSYADGPHADAARYDVPAGRWRRVPRAPLAARDWGSAVVWTGSRVLLWGGGEADRRFADGAALDPEGLTWTRLPAAPLPPRAPAAWAWTGNEFIVWGDRSRSARRYDGAAYDPQRRSWRPLPRAPLALNQVSSVWIGGELLIYGAWLDGNNQSRTRFAQGIAYRPATNRWRVLPSFKLSPQASSVALAGTRVLAWDYVLHAGLYDPTSDRWFRVAPLPFRAAECYPASVSLGDRVFAWYCGRSALFDPSSRTWTTVQAPRQGFTGGALVAAGSRAFLLGRPDRGGPPELWAYMP
jgi:hypothetical protein